MVLEQIGHLSRHSFPTQVSWYIPCPGLFKEPETATTAVNAVGRVPCGWMGVDRVDEVGLAADSRGRTNHQEAGRRVGGWGAGHERHG